MRSSLWLRYRARDLYRQILAIVNLSIAVRFILICDVFIQTKTDYPRTGRLRFLQIAQM